MKSHSPDRRNARRAALGEHRPRREISAGLVIFRRTSVGIKFLILYHGGNYWNFPKGHIEAGDAPQNSPQSGGAGAEIASKTLRAAIRETCEETGFTQNDLRIVKGFSVSDRYFFRRGASGIFKIVIYYLSETRNRRVIISEEHSGFGWFLYHDAIRILGKYHGSQRVLKQANDFLHSHARRQRT